MRESSGVKPKGIEKSNGQNIVHDQLLHRLLTCIKRERICWDPKDGELCLSRMKSEETLMEVRSDTDVQIVRLT